MAWSDLAAGTVDAAFATFGVAALYRPKAGSDAAVTVIRKRVDEIDFGIRGAVVPKAALDVRVSEIEQPAEGDLVEIGDKTFAVLSFFADSERLTWTLALRDQK